MIIYISEIFYLYDYKEYNTISLLEKYIDLKLNSFKIL